MDADTLDRDRVRVLLDRYGVVFRELLEREIAPLKWSALFRTLRVMELSGEVIGGRFFEGVRGLQFIAKDALPLLDRRPDPPPVFFLNAKDPASLCGVKIEGLSLPPRVQGTHLVYCGEDLVLVSKRNGKNLTFLREPDDPRLTDFLALFHMMLCRNEHPAARISIEKINDRRAWKSPYRAAFDQRFDTYADFGSLQIERRY